MIKQQSNVAGILPGGRIQQLGGLAVAVTNDRTGQLAALFLDAAGTQPLLQPLRTDAQGNYGYYAANGEYTERITGANIKPIERKVSLFDQDEGPIAGAPALAKAQRRLLEAVQLIGADVESLGAADGAGKVGHGAGTVADALKKSAVAAGPRDAVVYNSNISVRVFRNFATMGGFRFRGQYTRGHAPTFPMPTSKVASLGTQLGAGMTAATFENWYAVFACANDGDEQAVIKIMPFLRAGTVSGANVPLIKAGERVHALTAQSYAWGASNNMAGTECLVISENGGFSGRVTTITANSASQITVADAGSLAAYDFLLPAPPGFEHYAYLGSFYFDTAEVRNIYDSGTLVKAKMTYLMSPDVGIGVIAAPGQIMDCAGYISPLATAVTIDSSCALSTASTGQYVEYFDPDGSSHIVQTCDMYKATSNSQPITFDNVQVPFIYHQKFNFYNAGAEGPKENRINGQLNITGWIEP